jgi:hypothetical protein
MQRLSVVVRSYFVSSTGMRSAEEGVVAMRDQTVRVVARVVVRPGKEDELRTLLRGLIKPTRSQ